MLGLIDGSKKCRLKYIEIPLDTSVDRYCDTLFYSDNE